MKVVASIVSDVDVFFGVFMKLLSIGPRTDHCLLAWPVELMWLWSIETLHTVCLVGTSAYCASHIAAVVSIVVFFLLIL